MGDGNVVEFAASMMIETFFWLADCDFIRKIEIGCWEIEGDLAIRTLGSSCPFGKVAT